MKNLLGPAFEKMIRENVFQTSDSELLRKIDNDMKVTPEKWNGLAYLNSDNPDAWDRLIYKVIELQPSGWDIQWSKFVEFVKILSNNWDYNIPELLEELAPYDIDVDKFFMLERNVSFKLSALLSDINEIQKVMLRSGTDVAPFISKLSHAFLPAVVYQLEEYGLPRMISKKLHDNQVFDFLDRDLTIHSAIGKFHKLEEKIKNEEYLDNFDRYIVNYFYDGITIDDKQNITA